MISRLKIVWGEVRDSLWFIPATFTFAMAALAFGLVRLEEQHDWKLVEVDHWLLGGSVDSSRQVLSTIAGSLMTVTGVVFSVTIVALQLASSQFTPRILRNFMADRANQLVLAVFIGTFTYTLLVLRVIKSNEAEGRDLVPNVAVSLAIVLALASIGFLIYFIHHAARSVQASVVLERITREAMGHIARLFPEEVGKAEAEWPAVPERPAEAAQPVAARDEGYLQAVDGEALFQLGKRHRLFIRMKQPLGAFIVAGQTLAEVWSERECDDEVYRQICGAFIVGEERAPGEDFEYFLVEIADMAVKALSPSVNDPTTSVHCIDRLTQILLAVGKRRPPVPLRSESGEVHFLALPTTFESGAGVAFDQILHFGRDNPAIVEKLAYSIALLQELLPADRQPRLQDFAAKLDALSRGGG